MKKLIIAVINPKGGVGKTTTAVHLKVQERDSLLIDADPQRSASDWLDGCMQETDPSNLWEFLLDSQKLPHLTIIDCPAGESLINQNVLLCCDIALVPVQPSAIDIKALEKLLRLILTVQKQRRGDPKAIIILNRVKTGMLINDAVREILEQDSIISVASLIDFSIPDRAILKKISSDKITVFDSSDPSAKELSKIYSRLLEKIYGT